MTETQINGILDKVKKLLTLATNAGATPDEAASAAAMAQSLLFKHNLSMEDVDTQSAAEKQATAIGLDSFELGKDATLFMVGWHRALFHNLARHNFCQAVTYTGSNTGVGGKINHSRRMGIVGEQQNIEVVKWLYTHVSEQVERMARESQQKAHPYRKCRCERRDGCPIQLPGPRGVWIRTFCLGAVQTINERLAEQRQADEKTVTGTGMAMVLVSKEGLVKAAMDNFFPKLNKGNAAPPKGADAYGAGRKAGKNVNFNKALGAESNKRVK